MCHGPRGDAAGNLALRPTKRSLASLDTFTKNLREPPVGMPQFPENRVDQREASDLIQLHPDALSAESLRRAPLISAVLKVGLDPTGSSTVLANLRSLVQRDPGP